MHNIRVPPLRRSLVHVRRWLVAHDDRLGFTIAYIALAVVLSVRISLFWLVAVVALHGFIETWSLKRRGMGENRLGRVLWHLKLDIALVLFALWLGLYMDVLFGLAGLSAAARTTAQAGARFIAWKRAIRGVLLTLDDAAVVAKSVVGRGEGNHGTAEQESSSAAVPWRRPWGVGDWMSLTLATVFLALILLAPWLTRHDLGSMLAVMGRDLYPWP